MSIVKSAFLVYNIQRNAGDINEKTGSGRNKEQDRSD